MTFRTNYKGKNTVNCKGLTNQRGLIKHYSYFTNGPITYLFFAILVSVKKRQTHFSGSVIDANA